VLVINTYSIEKSLKGLKLCTLGSFVKKAEEPIIESRSRRKSMLFGNHAPEEVDKC
jgi:hypothetical protein